MKAWIYIFAVFLVSGFALFPSATIAAPYTLVDEITFEGREGYVSDVFSPGPHVLSYWHPSNNPVEIFPDKENILSAKLTITTKDDLHDPFSSREYWLVFTPERWLNDSNWWVPVFNGPHPFMLDVDHIRETGGKQITLMALWGDFFVTSSTLELTYEQGGQAASANPVPEPQTIFLLGTGIFGIAGFLQRKLR